MRRNVGEEKAADYVANRVKVWLRRPHDTVDDDVAALDHGARRLETDRLDVGRTAGCREHLPGLNLMRLATLRANRNADTACVHAHSGRIEPGVRHYGDAAFRERPRDDLRHRSILERETVGMYSSQVTSAPMSR